MQKKSKYKSGFRKNKDIKISVWITVSSILLVGVIGSLCYLIYYLNHKDTTATAINENEITVYTAFDTISHGQVITAGMLVETKKNDSYASFYSSLECIGQVAIVDIPKGMPLMQNMCRVLDVKSEEREVECEIITLSDNLMENDYVDVRLMLPNGEDYIVLAKKGVHDLYRSEDDKEEVCYLWLSEEEILNYSAAVIDAYLYQGGCLYTTKYIEPTLQTASIVTYVPSLGTLAMMKENPNLFEIAVSQLKLDQRKLLENRLTDYLNLDIRERNWNISKDQSEIKIQGVSEEVGNDALVEKEEKPGENYQQEVNNQQSNADKENFDASAFLED